MPSQGICYIYHMEKLDVKLIALDLDDTLLNDERKITDDTVSALRLK